jgi:hypothetical protein
MSEPKPVYETMDGLMAKTRRITNEYIEAMAAAYHRATGISPQDAVLVHHSKMEGNTLVNRWWFETKEEAARRGPVVMAPED